MKLFSMFILMFFLILDFDFGIGQRRNSNSYQRGVSTGLGQQTTRNSNTNQNQQTIRNSNTNQNQQNTRNSNTNQNQQNTWNSNTNLNQFNRRNLNINQNQHNIRDSNTNQNQQNTRNLNIKQNQQTNKGLNGPEIGLRKKLGETNFDESDTQLFNQHFTNIANAKGKHERTLHQNNLAKDALHISKDNKDLNNFARGYNNYLHPLPDHMLVPTQTNVNARFQHREGFKHSGKNIHEVGQYGFKSEDFKLKAKPYIDSHREKYPYKLLVDNNRGLTAHAIAGKTPSNVGITGNLNNNREFTDILASRRQKPSEPYKPFRMGFDRNTDDASVKKFMDMPQNRYGQKGEKGEKGEKGQFGVPIGIKVGDSDVYNPLLYSRTMNDPAPIVTPDIFRNSRNQG